MTEERRGRVTRYLETATPEALFVLSALSQYIGAAIAVSVFDEVEPQTVAWFRVIGAALALLAVSRGVGRGWTRSSTRRGGDLRRGDGADEHVLLPRHRSHRSRQGRGDRVPRPDRGGRGDDPHLAQRRSTRAHHRRRGDARRRGARRQRRSAWCSSSPRRRCGPPTSSSGPGSHRSVAALRRLGVGLSIGAVALTPIGAPWSGPVWASPTLLVAVSAHRRVLERDRLRHRPVRPASHPDPPILLAAGVTAGHRARRRLGRTRPAAVRRRSRRHLARARRSRAPGARRTGGGAGDPRTLLTGRVPRLGHGSAVSARAAPRASPHGIDADAGEVTPFDPVPFTADGRLRNRLLVAAGVLLAVLVVVVADRRDDGPAVRSDGSARHRSPAEAIADRPATGTADDPGARATSVGDRRCPAHRDGIGVGRRPAPASDAAAGACPLTDDTRARPTGRAGRSGRRPSCATVPTGRAALARGRAAWPSTRTAAGYVATDVGCASSTSAGSLDAFFRDAPRSGARARLPARLHLGGTVGCGCSRTRSSTTRHREPARPGVVRPQHRDGAGRSLLHAPHRGPRPRRCRSSRARRTDADPLVLAARRRGRGRPAVVFWVEMVKSDRLATARRARVDPGADVAGDVRRGHAAPALVPPAPDPGVAPDLRVRRRAATATTRTCSATPSTRTSPTRAGTTPARARRRRCTWPGCPRGQLRRRPRVPQRRRVDRRRRGGDADRRRGTRPRTRCSHGSSAASGSRSPRSTGTGASDLAIDVANQPWGPWTTVDLRHVGPSGRRPADEHLPRPPDAVAERRRARRQRLPERRATCVRDAWPHPTATGSSSWPPRWSPHRPIPSRSRPRS